MQRKKVLLLSLIVLFLFSFVVFSLRQRIHLLAIYLNIKNNHSEILSYLPKDKKYDYDNIHVNYTIGYVEFYNPFGDIRKKDQSMGGSIKIETATADVLFLRPSIQTDFELRSNEQVDILWTPINGKLVLRKAEDYKEFEKRWIDDRIGYEKKVLNTQPKPILQLAFLSLPDLAEYVYRLQWKIFLLKDPDIFFIETPNVKARLTVKEEGHVMGENVIEILLNDHVQQVSQTIFVKGRDRLLFDETKKFVSKFKYLPLAQWPDTFRLKNNDEIENSGEIQEQSSINNDNL